MLPRLKWVSDLTENPKFVKSNEKFPQQKLFQGKPNPAQQKAPPRRVLFRLKLSFSFVLPYSFDTSVTPGAAVLPAQLWRQIALIPESSQIPITSGWSRSGGGTAVTSHPSPARWPHTLPAVSGLVLLRGNLGNLPGHPGQASPSLGRCGMCQLLVVFLDTNTT